MENLNRFLSKLNEEGDQEKVAGINKQKSGLSSTGDFDKMPSSLKTMWREYERAGGHDYDSVWDFLDDVVGFLKSKKFTGRHVAEWDRKAEKDITEE